MADDRPDLDALSDRELHDRALGRAVRHADVGYFKRLFEIAPAAAAGAGELDKSFNDVLRPSSLLTEVVDRDPALLEALRPYHLEYLRAHER